MRYNVQANFNAAMLHSVDVRTGRVFQEDPASFTLYRLNRRPPRIAHSLVFSLVVFVHCGLRRGAMRRIV